MFFILKAAAGIWATKNGNDRPAKFLASMDIHEPKSFPLCKGELLLKLKKASKPPPEGHNGTTGTKIQT